MVAVENQIRMAREGGLQIVRILATGERGWVVGGLGMGALTIRVRIAGPRTNCKNVYIDDVQFED